MVRNDDAAKERATTSTPGHEQEGVRAEQTGQVIDETVVAAAMQRFQKYKQQRANLELRLIENEEYYRQRYERVKQPGGNLPARSSAYLLNAITNKVSDIMDNYPEAAILPREESDQTTADLLSKVVPVVLQRNDFMTTYYRAALAKVKNGFSVMGAFWNPIKDGIGEVEVREIDPLNLFWEPGIRNIQDSKELFLVNLVDDDVLERMYPSLKGLLAGNAKQVEQYYHDDQTDISGKTEVYDWYYKTTVGVEVEGQVFPRTVLHYCKFAAGKVLYASENDTAMGTRGWYEDGDYPVVFDVMYPIKDSPCGFGQIDMMRSPQEFIDRIDCSVLQNVLAGARPRYFSKLQGGINEEEFTNFDKTIVHYMGNPEDLVNIECPQLPEIYVAYLENKKEELKENTGNRDFSQGTTTGGVTAASAIAALQEASSKTSRTINQISYEAFKRLVRMIISRMQQFYTVERTFRVTVNNEQLFMNISSQSLRGGTMDETLGDMVGGRIPVYDIEISAQKASPYSRIANNEFAKELFQLGFFNPQLADQVVPALEMMDFDGKDKALKTVKQNQQLYIQNQQMQQLLAGLGPIIAQATGDTQILQMFGGESAETGAAQQPIVSGVEGNDADINQLGETTVYKDNSAATQAKKTARSASEVQV